MLNINIQDVSYKVHVDWTTITINKAAEIALVIEDMPEKLMAIYESRSIKHDDDRAEAHKEALDAIEENDWIKVFPVWYGKLLQTLSNIPEEVINNIQWDHRTSFYDKYLADIVSGIMYFPTDYKVSYKAIYLDGEWLEKPAGKVVLGEMKPLADQDAITFCQGADLQIAANEVLKSKFEYAKNVLSILCRPKGEPYNEDKSLARAEKMGEQCVTHVFDVFFCLQVRNDISKLGSAISTIQSKLGQPKQALQAMSMHTDG